jgi:hypothetical protein
MSDECIEKRECFDLRQLCRGDIMELKEDVGIAKGELKMAAETIIATTAIVQKNAEQIGQIIASQSAIVDRQNKTEVWMQTEITAGRKSSMSLTQKLLWIVTVVTLVLIGAKEYIGL